MTSELFLFLNIGTSEMILILVIALFFFGGKKLPELARGLGRGIREFKDASETIKRDISDQINNFEKDIEIKDEPKAIAQHSVESKGSPDFEANTGEQGEIENVLNGTEDMPNKEVDQYDGDYHQGSRPTRKAERPPVDNTASAVVSEQEQSTNKLGDSNNDAAGNA